MGAIASQTTSLTIVYSTVYSGAEQSKHQSSASLAFAWGIHRGPVNSPHKWPVYNEENVSICWHHHDKKMNMPFLITERWLLMRFTNKHIREQKHIKISWTKTFLAHLVDKNQYVPLPYWTSKQYECQYKFWFIAGASKCHNMWLCNRKFISI